MTLTNEECRRLLSRYEEALSSRSESKKGKDNKLLSLDSWRLNNLPSIVGERSPHHMNLKELEQLMDCKLSRGKFRPRLKQLISSNSSIEVEQTTTEAFSQPLTSLAKILAAVKGLSVLKGVGPATATMILQAFSNDVPFMSDEAMLQVFNGDKSKLKYDVKTCGIFIEKIQGLLKSLGGEFSAAEVERALFTKEILGDVGDEDEKAPTNPRGVISPPPAKPEKKRPLQEDKKRVQSKKAKKGDKDVVPDNTKARRTSLGKK